MKLIIVSWSIWWYDKSISAIYEFQIFKRDFECFWNRFMKELEKMYVVLWIKYWYSMVTNVNLIVAIDLVHFYGWTNYTSLLFISIQAIVVSAIFTLKFLTDLVEYGERSACNKPDDYVCKRCSWSDVFRWYENFLGSLCDWIRYSTWSS